MDERIETNNTEKEKQSNFIDKLNKIDANIDKAIPRYIRINKDIIKSVMYWGFNMTFQLVASWLFVLMLFGKPENINVKQVVICTCLGLCISLVFALLMPSLTKNKLIYKGFKSFFATKSGYCNMKNHLFKHMWIGTGIGIVIILLYRFIFIKDMTITADNYESIGQFLLNDFTSGNEALGNLIYIIGIYIILLMLVWMFIGTNGKSPLVNYDINKAFFQINHNKNLEDAYINKDEFSNEILNQRNLLYNLTFNLFSHSKYNYNEIITHIIGFWEEIDISNLSEQKKRSILFTVFMDPRFLLKSYVYIDTTSLCEDINKVNICQEGKIIETLNIKYTKNNIILVNANGEEGSIITFCDNAMKKDENLEREV